MQATLRNLLICFLFINSSFQSEYIRASRDVIVKPPQNGRFCCRQILHDHFQIQLTSVLAAKLEFRSVTSKNGVRKKKEPEQNIMVFHAWH